MTMGILKLLWTAIMILCQLGQGFLILRQHWDMILALKKLIGEETEASALVRKVVTGFWDVILAWKHMFGDDTEAYAAARKSSAIVVSAVLGIVATLWGGYYWRDLIGVVVALSLGLCSDFFTIFLMILVTLLCADSYRVTFEQSEGLGRDDIFGLCFFVVVFHYLLKGLFALVVAVLLYSGLSSDTFFTVVSVFCWANGFSNEFCERLIEGFLETGNHENFERTMRELPRFICVLVAGYCLSSGLQGLLLAIHFGFGWSFTIAIFVVTFIISGHFIEVTEKSETPGVLNLAMLLTTVTTWTYCLWRFLPAVTVAVHVYSKLPSKILSIALVAFLANFVRLWAIKMQQSDSKEQNTQLKEYPKAMKAI